MRRDANAAGVMLLPMLPFALPLVLVLLEVVLVVVVLCRMH